MSGNKNPDVSVMSKCWKGTRTLSCMNTLLCYCGFKHSSGSDWSRVLENTLYVVFKDRCICMNMFCRWAVPSWPSFPFFLTSSLPLPSSFLSAFLEYQLISLHSSPVWQLFAPLLFFGFHPFSLSWHKLSHTDSGECQECVRSCSIMLLLHKWPQLRGLRSASVFAGPMDGQMDRYRHWMIDEEVRPCWPSP